MSLAESMHGLNGLGETQAFAGERRTIPFDYAFRYDLEGEPNLVQNSTVNVSIEAMFTAVSIGYGLVPKVQPIKFGVVRKGAPTLSASDSRASRLESTPFGQIVSVLSEALDEERKLAGGKIGPRTAAVLKDGFKLNPELIERILLSGTAGQFDREILEETFQTVTPCPEQIQFKYALFDDGTGREFQSEPILNIAGLGIADGMRPFRYFARPIEFAPRSTIRMQITELSEFQGELHVSLQGFKTLGAPGSPTHARQRAARSRRMRR